MRDLLKDCWRYYTSGVLRRECNSTNNCLGIEERCMEKGSVFRILHDFTDKDFLVDGNLQLKYSMIYIKWNGKPESLQAFFSNHIGENEVRNDFVKYHGMSLTINRIMFEQYIIQDLVWYGLAMGIVVLLLVIYLRSFVLMLTVILNVVFSLSIAYFFYFTIFRFSFFPFINILSALLLIALGADDLFIFYDLWRDEKELNKDATYEELVSTILYKGGTSVFVTSFTTATALLANFVNDVTAIRCFGGFAAICVVVNFLLFITWVPAVIVVTDYAYTSCMGDDFCHDKATTCCQCLFKLHDVIWKKVVPKLVTKGALFWIILILILSTGSLVATFYKPQLKLPSSNNFQPFVKEHPFEIYNGEVKKHLRFEKTEDFPLYVQYMWGVEGTDNGNMFDPKEIGSLIRDETFDLYSASVQEWMYNFCEDLRQAPFLEEEFREKSKCFFQIYKDFISIPCRPGSACCDIKAFPPPYEQSKHCMREVAFSIHNPDQDKDSDTNLIGFPLFDKDGEVVTFQMFFKSRFKWTGNYEIVDGYYKLFTDFMDDHLFDVPEECANGFFTGGGGTEFRFYDLQKSLASGTMSGIGVSIAIGTVVLLLTTQNIFLTFYAILTIALVLSTTSGCLALMGWELNTSEALILTLSMGLSIDFTIHHGIAYKLAPQKTREEKVSDALSTVGSAITMAAMTTFGAGASMISASVWAYRQFGMFLVLTMVFSWFYANFFFLSICSTIGPVGRFGDFGFVFEKLKQRLFSRNSKKNSKNDSTYYQSGTLASSRVYANHDQSWDHRGHDNNTYDAAPPEVPPRPESRHDMDSYRNRHQEGSHRQDVESPPSYNSRHYEESPPKLKSRNHGKAPREGERNFNNHNRHTVGQPTTGSLSPSSYRQSHSKHRSGDETPNTPRRNQYRRERFHDTGDSHQNQRY